MEPHDSIQKPVTKPELVESVIPLDLFEDFYVTTDEPVAALVNHFDVRVVRMTGSKLTACSLFFIMPVEFSVTYDGIILSYDCYGFLMLIFELKLEFKRYMIGFSITGIRYQNDCE